MSRSIPEDCLVLNIEFYFGHKLLRAATLQIDNRDWRSLTGSNDSSLTPLDVKKNLIKLKTSILCKINEEVKDSKKIEEENLTLTLIEQKDTNLPMVQATVIATKSQITEDIIKEFAASAQLKPLFIFAPDMKKESKLDVPSTSSELCFKSREELDEHLGFNYNSPTLNEYNLRLFLTRNPKYAHLLFLESSLENNAVAQRHATMAQYLSMMSLSLQKLITEYEYQFIQNRPKFILSRLVLNPLPSIDKKSIFNIERLRFASIALPSKWKPYAEFFYRDIWEIQDYIFGLDELVQLKKVRLSTMPIQALFFQDNRMQKISDCYRKNTERMSDIILTDKSIIIRTTNGLTQGLELAVELNFFPDLNYREYLCRTLAHSFYEDVVTKHAVFVVGIHRAIRSSGMMASVPNMLTVFDEVIGRTPDADFLKESNSVFVNIHANDHPIPEKVFAKRVEKLKDYAFGVGLFSNHQAFAKNIYNLVIKPTVQSEKLLQYQVKEKIGKYKDRDKIFSKKGDFYKALLSLLNVEHLSLDDVDYKQNNESDSFPSSHTVTP